MPEGIPGEMPACDLEPKKERAEIGNCPKRSSASLTLSTSAEGVFFFRIFSFVDGSESKVADVQHPVVAVFELFQSGGNAPRVHTVTPTMSDAGNPRSEI